MTDRELDIARRKYKQLLEGKRKMLECFNDKDLKSFAFDYYGINEEKILSIQKEEIIKRAFLSTFQETNQSNNIMVYLNLIQKTNSEIDGIQSEFVSINWKNANQPLPKGLQMYSLYCDLETNNPILVDMNNFETFCANSLLINLPDYIMQTETYYYHGKSLEKISKGSATEKFNKLQLFYFQELLQNSKEEVLNRMRSLTPQDYTSICLK